MNVDQTISLFSSIGACLAAIAAYLAIYRDSKQRRESYRPELTIARALFACESNLFAGGPYPGEWTAVEGGDAEESSAYVPLSNVGLGAAKNVEITWSFPLEESVATINAMAQKTLSAVFLEFDGKSLAVTREPDGELRSMWENQRVQQIDYVLPASSDPAPFRVGIPPTYTLIVSALLHFRLKTEEVNFGELPELTAEISFFDIGGKRHRRKTRVVVDVIMIEETGKRFRGLFTSDRVA